MMPVPALWRVLGFLPPCSLARGSRDPNDHDDADAADADDDGSGDGD